MTKVRVTEKRVVLDIDRCIGCYACAVACYESHREKQNLSRAQFDITIDLPQHCKHCTEPSCVEACPVEALEKREDGLVYHNNFRCIGCLSCTYACPFGVLKALRVRHIVSKCDLCCDRLEEEKDPRCVETCTAGALSYIPIIDEEEREKGRVDARIKAKPWRR
ncbi:4Fe-4S dicluster domain-containing protein [candidate division WOR-3 bacterium]|nr:4Fe-4S dicluster domain-containing protein [candidate division WOR-3 bacterium]